MFDSSSANVLGSAVLCRLYKSALETFNDVIVHETHCIYISSDAVYMHAYLCSQPRIVFENIVSISYLGVCSQHVHMYVALSKDGYLIKLTHEDTNFMMCDVGIVKLDTCLNITCELSNDVIINYDICSQLLTIRCALTGFAVLHVDIECEQQFNLATIFQDSTVNTTAKHLVHWGSLRATGKTGYIVTSGDSSSVQCIVMSVSTTPADLVTPRNSNIRSETVPSSHRGWITALSTSIAPCDLGASGDCLGALCVWMCMKICDTTTCPLQLLLTDRTLTDGNAINAILVDSVCNKLWIADCSGTVTCVHLSFRPKPSVEVLTCVTCLHGPSSSGATMLKWKPNPMVTSELKGGSGADRVSGTLCCFSAHSGILIECNLPHNVSSMFRVWPEYSQSNEHKSLVEVCCVVIAMNCIVTAGVASQLFVWDMDSGRLVQTISVANPLCRCLCAVEVNGNQSIASSSTVMTYVVSGHSNGAVGIIKLSVTDATQDKSDVNSAEADDVQHKKQHTTSSRSQESVSQVALFDIIEAGSEYVVSRPNNNTLDKAADIDTNEILGVEDEKDGNNHKQQYQLQEQNSLLYSYRDVLNSRVFLPLPVTDVFLSSRGGYLAICYIRQFIVVYDIKQDKVMHNMKFDERFTHISTVSFNEEGCSSHNNQLSSSSSNHTKSDSLMLSLQSIHKIKLFDVIKGIILTEFDLHTRDRDVVCSGLWDEPAAVATAAVVNNNKSNDRSLSGICVTKDFSVFLFSESAGFIEHTTGSPDSPKNLKHKRSVLKKVVDSIEGAASLDTVIQSLEIYSSGMSPLVTIWSLRKLIVMRLTLENTKPEVMRTVEFTVRDDKVRIIYACALKTQPHIRAHRALVVLSDGTAYIVHI